MPLYFHDDSFTVAVTASLLMLFSFERVLVLQKSHDVGRREVGLPYDVLKEGKFCRVLPDC